MSNRYNHYIIIGFPGVGKTTMCKDNLSYIDLESSAFMIDGERHENWYKEYVNTAIYLSKNHNVFISSHDVVQDYLEEKLSIFSNIIIVYPDKSLKKEWLERLRNRYKTEDLIEILNGQHVTDSNKNKRALEYVEKNWDSCIEAIENRQYFYKLKIYCIDQAYNLESILKKSMSYIVKYQTMCKEFDQIFDNGNIIKVDNICKSLNF